MKGRGERKRKKKRKCRENRNEREQNGEWEQRECNKGREQIQRVMRKEEIGKAEKDSDDQEEMCEGWSEK